MAKQSGAENGPTNTLDRFRGLDADTGPAPSAPTEPTPGQLAAKRVRDRRRRHGKSALDAYRGQVRTWLDEGQSLREITRLLYQKGVVVSHVALWKWLRKHPKESSDGDWPTLPAETEKELVEGTQAK